MTTFQKDLRYDPTTHDAETFTTDGPPTEEERIEVFNGKQALQHEKNYLGSEQNNETPQA